MEHVFRVSEFNEFIDIYLGGAGEVAVSGEISSIKLNQNKYIFITIKDEEASLDVFAIRYNIKNFDVFEVGMKVIVYGRARLYKKVGRFSLFADEIAPSGKGAIQVAFEKLKTRLAEEGLFDTERKREIPAFPQRIGLITAKGSEAYGDFVKITGSGAGGLTIYFYAVQVQGKGAVESIIEAFEYFNKKLSVDVVAVVRGGGSAEDLAAFNDEGVVKAVFASRAPVVSGVGHEGDVTLTDLVADVRASTPTNAAEIIVRDRREATQSVDSLVERLSKEIDYKFTTIQSEIDRILKQNAARLSQIFEYKSQTLADLESVVKSYSIDGVLRRGFGLVYINGKLVKKIGQVMVGGDVETRVWGGKFGSVVSNVTKDG